MRPLRLDHAVVRVPEFEPSLTWYREAIGLMEMSRDDGTIYLGCGGDGRFDLALVRGGLGLDHMSFSAPDAASFGELEARLRQAGVDCAPSGGEPGIERAFRFSMPSGHRFEVVLNSERCGYLHQSQWNPAALHAPLDLNHVTLVTSETRGLAEFLAGRLDFRISDVFEPAPDVWGAAFTRSGENHHDVAILQGEDELLHHVAFAVTDISALLSFCDRLARLGHAVEYGLGRHGPGGNIFCYVLDPAGNRVELTTDMARVSDWEAPTRFWRGDFLSILNVWARLPPPESFARGT